MTTNTYEVTHWREGRVFVSAAHGSEKDDWGLPVRATAWGTTEDEAKATANQNLIKAVARRDAQRAKIAEERELVAPYINAARSLARYKLGPQVPFQKPTTVGSQAIVWGHGDWRTGIVVWLSPTRKVAKVLYFTPSQMVQHLTKTNEFWV